MPDKKPQRDTTAIQIAGAMTALGAITTAITLAIALGIEDRGIQFAVALAIPIVTGAFTIVVGKALLHLVFWPSGMLLGEERQDGEECE